VERGSVRNSHLKRDDISNISMEFPPNAMTSVTYMEFPPKCDDKLTSSFPQLRTTVVGMHDQFFHRFHHYMMYNIDIKNYSP